MTACDRKEVDGECEGVVQIRVAIFLDLILLDITFICTATLVHVDQCRLEGRICGCCPTDGINERLIFSNFAYKRVHVIRECLVKAC